MRLCTSKGGIRYDSSTSYPYRVIVEVNPEIARFARSLIPLYLPFNYPKYPPHISVVRKEILNLEAWKKLPFVDEEVEFSYSPEVQMDETYYWLRVFCPKLSELRVALGLSPCRFMAPEGEAVFHITIANRK